MDSMIPQVLLALVTAGVVGVIGAMWRFAHKVTRLENESKALRGRIQRMEVEHDKVMDRLYSVAKSRGDFITRDTYNRDKLVEQALDAARNNVRPHT
jgi:ferritin-like protein